MEKIRLADMCKRLNLEQLCGKNDSILYFSDSEIIAAGLTLSGFKTDLKGRAVILSAEESNYLATLDEPKRQSRLKLIMDAELIILTCEVLKPMLSAVCGKYNTPLVYSSKQAVHLDISLFIKGKLNAVDIIHGVLMDVFGVGTLILGESGIGKSEVALELVARNHLLVADDAVAIRREGSSLIGCSPRITRHLMELRGIGIIDVRAMYGSGAIKIEQELDMAITLEPLCERDYMKPHTYELLGVSVPQFILPVSYGRNLAVIIEAAARNLRLKSMGYDAFEELNKRIAQDRHERHPSHPNK